MRRRIGYLPEDTPLYRDMTVLEYLEFVCDMRDVPKDVARAARLRKRVVEQCGIGDRLGALIGELSKGFRQRVGLAQAIVHEPEVLILDEPTSGLDPNQIAEIRGVIKSIGQEKTVIFSTHILGEVQATCSRVIIISDGKLVADGTPDELARKSSGAASILLEIGGARGNDTDPLGAAPPHRRHRGGQGDQHRAAGASPIARAPRSSASSPSRRRSARRHRARHRHRRAAWTFCR